MREGCASRRRRERRCERRGPGAGDADAAQAGLQSPGALPWRRQRACRGAPASWRGWPRCWKRLLAEGDRALIFTQFAEMGDGSSRYLQERFGVEVLYPARRRPRRSSATRMVERFQAAGRAAALPALAQGRRHRPEPDARQPRLPLRPLVEPGRRESGDRPRLPHRADAQRPGAQVRLRRHAGGAHRHDDRAEARRWPSRSSAAARAG